MAQVITPKILLGIPDPNGQPVIRRITDGPQKLGELCLFAVCGRFEPDPSFGSPRELKGHFEIIDCGTLNKLPIKPITPWWNASRNWYEFKIVFTLIVGRQYTLKAVFRGEPEDAAPVVFGRAVSDQFVWDLMA
jgi:hypothetical protein